MKTSFKYKVLGTIVFIIILIIVLVVKNGSAPQLDENGNPVSTEQIDPSQY